MPVAVTLGPLVAASIAKTAEKLGQFLFEHGLNGGTDIRPQAILDRIIPACVGQRRKGRAIGILLHGVISLAVAAAGWVGVGSPGEYASQFLPLPRDDRGAMDAVLLHGRVLSPAKADKGFCSLVKTFAPIVMSNNAPGPPRPGRLGEYLV